MANSALKPPGPLDFMLTNLPARWKVWKEEITLYIELALDGKSDAYKRKTLLYLVGDRGREIYRTLPFEVGEEDRTVNIIIQAFDAFCLPKENETLERYHFNRRSQLEGENFEQFLTSLRTLASTCNFGDLENSLLRDRIVCGITNSSTREKLLREEDLNLEKCIMICKAVECTDFAVKEFAEPSNEVNKVFKRHFKELPARKCKFCAKEHILRKLQCPAYGKTCTKCNEPNHFAVCCPTNSKRNARRNFSVKHIANNHPDQLEDDDSEDCYTFVNAVHCDKSAKKKLFARLTLLSGIVKFQIDTGATCNLVPLSVLTHKEEMSIDKSKSCTLKMYNGSEESTIGELVVKMINSKTNDKYKVLCSVIDDSISNCTPILGSSAAQAMKLIIVKHENICKISHDTLTREVILNEFSDVFDHNSQGRLPGECKLYVDTNVKPVIQPPRRVPVSIKEKLLQELNRLEKAGIVSKQNEPTDWVSSLVCVTKKSGSLRICIDPKPLNTALKRNHYPMRTIDDILPDLGKMKVFSTFDARNGYWHVKLDKKSSLLTCFNTPYGKYIWNVLPMGIKPASEEYQKRQDDALSGLKNVYCIADDILVAGEGETLEEATANHDVNVRNFLQRCREKDLRLNSDKMKLNEKSVQFIGHTLTRDGLKMDPEKISAIVDMPPPADVTGVRRLLGMINYLSKFVPALSDVCRPIRLLTLASVEFRWEREQQLAFEELKRIITRDPVLQYYNPALPIVIQCDASSKVGLGCCLLQNNLPVSYASRALTETETRYSIMELELLAILFAVKKFHQYVFGADIEIHSDHRPLQAIFDKPIHIAPKRLQRMLIQLQNYNIKILYKPGSTMHIADTLSRAVNPANTKMHPCEKEILEINLLKNVPISEKKLKEIQKLTDSAMKLLKETITKGWPLNKEDVPDAIKPFYDFKGELTVYDGVILKGDKVVIPPALRPEILRQLHSTHIGIESCIRRSRECVFWPRITADIRDFLSHCDICNAYADKNQKEPLQPKEISVRPWEKVSIDLCSIDNRDYLICVDHFSNFTEIEYLSDQTAETVISKLKLTFARHGIPDECYSDQATIFTGMRFKRFAEKWAFKHIMSSPTHSQSNGKAENAVKTMKRLILKCKLANTDPYLSILEFRNTPSQYTNTSPTQRLFNRKTKTLLPTTDAALKFRPLDYERHNVDKQAAIDRMKYYYDQHTKPLPALKTGEYVRIQPDRHKKQWRPGIITNPSPSGRSYDVGTPQGKIHRNRVHLRKSTYADVTPTRSHDPYLPSTPAKQKHTHLQRTPSHDSYLPSTPAKQKHTHLQSATQSVQSQDELVEPALATKHTRTRTIHPPRRFEDFV